VRSEAMPQGYLPALLDTIYSIPSALR